MVWMAAVNGQVDLILGAVLTLCLIWCCHSVSTELKECLRNNSIVCGQCDGVAAGRSQYPGCESCIDNRLEPSSNCTQCKCGEPNCSMGNFTLSVYFHSYLNEKHLCGECQENKIVCCDTADQTMNCSDSVPCEIRLMVSVESYKAPPRDIYLPRRRPDFMDTDNITMFMKGEDVFSMSNISNPYQVQLDTWTGQIQFYAVVYDAYLVNNMRMGRFAVDRFTVNIDLGEEVPADKSRQTYYGIYNISKFDLSFNIKCSEGFTGPSCNISTSCDDPCPTIPAPICDLDTTSAPTGTSSSVTPGETEVSTDSRMRGTVPGVAIGVIVAVLMVCLLLVILGFLLYRQRRRKRNADLTHTLDLASKHHDNSADVVNIKDFDNPIYKVEEDAKGEHVYSQPSSSQLNDKPETINKGGGNEREFQNSIYGHDLVSTAYSDTAVERSSSRSSASTSNRRTQEANSVQNGGVVYAVLDNKALDNKALDQYDNVLGANEQQMADVRNRQRHIKLRPPIGRYEVSDAPQVEQYSEAHAPGNENYEVAHPPRDEHYDVTRATGDQTTHPPSDQYDVAHPPSDQYDVAHPPSDQYDVAHPPSDQYDVAHVPKGQYNVAHPPSDQYDVAHPSSDQYDVAHPPTSGMGKPFEDQYDVAHPPPMSGYDDVLVKAAGGRHMKGTSAQSNPYGTLYDDQYDVAHPPPSNNYDMITGQDARYDVAHAPTNGSRVAGNQHLHSNPRYESANMGTTNFYSVLDPSLESASH